MTLWLPFNFHSSHAGIIVFALVYGFVSGAFVSLLMPCAAKSGSLDKLGQRFGTFQFVIAVRSDIGFAIDISCLETDLSRSTLTGLPIMGAILERQRGTNYEGLQIFSGLSCLLGSGLLAASTYFLSQRHESWKV